MRRPAGRIIYNGAVVVSLLLCLATVGVWVRSYWVEDQLWWYQWTADQSSFDIKGICCSRGGLQFSSCHCVGGGDMLLDGADFHYYRVVAAKYPVYYESVELPLSSSLRRYSALGFELIPEAKGRVRLDPGSAFVLSSLTLPLYFPTLLFALLPAQNLLRVRRQRRIASRRARGCCIFCGYDLRASAGRCPECGAACKAADPAGESPVAGD